MKCSEKGECKKASGYEIASEEDEIDEEYHEKHSLSGKVIDHIAAEQADDKGNEGIARKDKSDGVLWDWECLTKIEG